MPSGGIILADNTLWSGKILDPEAHNDAQTKEILKFNDHVAADPRVEKRDSADTRRNDHNQEDIESTLRSLSALSAPDTPEASEISEISD